MAMLMKMSCTGISSTHGMTLKTQCGGGYLMRLGT